jgi:Peptidase M15
VGRYMFVAVLTAFSILATAEPASALDGKTGGLNRRLVGLLRQVERHFGRPVTIVSGCRSHSHNRRIGGARESFHLRCLAADIKVAGVSKSAVAQFANRLPGRGGVGSYCHDVSTHIDVGPRRNWVWTCSGKRIYTGLPAKVRVAMQ